MANEQTKFRVHFRYEVPGGTQKQTFDVLADTPRGADCAVRRAYPGKRVFIDKIKAIKEDV